MFDFDVDVDQFAKIKVISVGGGVETMQLIEWLNTELGGIDFIALNTDRQAFYILQRQR